MVNYYLCSVCGNMVEMVDDQGNNPFCCSKPMRLQEPGSTDSSLEKHVPVMTLSEIDTGIIKVTVNAGAEEHPMTEMHHIKWIALQTDAGMYRISLSPGCKPSVSFYIKNGEIILGAYVYCNLHGLWIDSQHHYYLK